MKRGFVLAAPLLAVALSLAAQPGAHQGQSAPPTPQASQPVFRSGVDLVRLDVRVTGADERPIKDLRAEEVEISEEGARRPILLFQHVEDPEGSYAEIARRTIAAEVSTNQGSPRGHVYVLVFDQSHILPGHEQRARLAAEHFLRTRIRPGDRVALFALPGPGPQIEFTSDATRVTRELKSVVGAGQETGNGATGVMLIYDAYEIARGNQLMIARYADLVAQAPLATTTPAPSTLRPLGGRATEDPATLRRLVQEDARTLVGIADGESRRFLSSLADVVRTLRSVEGRKAVILFSEGFEVDNVTRELEEVAAAAAQSYSVVFAMDLNPRSVSVSAEGPRGGEQFSEIRSRLQSLGTLTGETDGTIIIDALPQLDRALTRIAETSQDYYLVGFAPSETALRHRASYRRIAVKVNRAGARVSARTGYALNPEQTPADRRRTIDAALRAPFSQQGLRVEYTTYVLAGSSPGMQRVVVSLAAEVPVATSDARHADVVFAVRNTGDGRIAASGSDLMPLPEAAREGASTGVGLYRVQFEMPAGSYLMRAVVREPGGLLGSADRRFQVRALGGPGVTAGDLVLGSADVRGLPVRATAYTSEGLTGVLEIYGRSADRLKGITVTAELLSLASHAAALSAPAELQEIKVTDRGASRGARILLPLEGVVPGQYLVRARVRSGQETAAELLRDVHVLAGSPPAAPRPSPEKPAAFRPLDVLRGDIARRYLAALRSRTAGGPLESAARAAAEGDWSAADAAASAVQSQAADAQALRGLAAFARADYGAAATTLAAAQERAPVNADLAFLLGWAHAAAGDDRLAVGVWRSAVLADTSLVPGYLALVDAYLRLGQPDLALQVVRSGLAALPGSPELLDRLARLERR